MEEPMAGTFRLLAARLAALLGVAWAGLGVGCVSTLDVVSDEGEDFASYRTWDWLPRLANRVDAPHASEAALDARLARTIERTLAAEGFERDASPDFFVTYHLALRRHREIVNVPSAPYLLSSMNASASYWVERSHQEERVYEVVLLAIGVTRDGRSMPWHATLVRRIEDGATLPLDDAVETLLGRFPARGPASPTDP
jgi:hypothetical protein